MTYLHAWAKAVEEARAEADAIVGEPVEPGLVATRAAYIVGPLENGWAVAVRHGRSSIERVGRDHYDRESLGGEWRVMQAMNRENIGPSGERQDAIVHEYINLTGIGHWAEAYLRSREEETCN